LGTKKAWIFDFNTNYTSAEIDLNPRTFDATTGGPWVFRE
jgi:hypothetical protein